MNKKYTYRIIIEPDLEDGGFVVSVPALPGCHTQGNTYEEAIQMVREAIVAYIGSMLKDGQEIPTEEPLSRRVESVVEVQAPALA